MHKLIVYWNGVTNPTITKPHGMTYEVIKRRAADVIDMANHVEIRVKP